MKLNILTLVLLCAALVSSACRSAPGVMPMGPDTYTVMERSARGPVRAKEAALNKANTYAAERDMAMVPIRENTQLDGRMATYELVFALAPHDGGGDRPRLEPPVAAPAEDAHAEPGLPATTIDRLRDLKALLDEGVLTQEEFDEQKTILLSGKHQAGGS